LRPAEARDSASRVEIRKRVIVLSIPDWGVTPFAQGQDRALIGKQIRPIHNATCAEECARQKVALIDINPQSKRDCRR
jgi:hypothetical protein